jgi:hypothetical protein
VKDPYAVLGIPKDASDAQIRYAYRQALREREGEPSIEVKERMDEVRACGEAPPTARRPHRRASRRRGSQYSKRRRRSGRATPSPA